MTIITIRDTESVNKPTIYVKELEGEATKPTIERHLKAGLKDCFTSDDGLHEDDVSEAVYNLRHDGYTWIRERYLIEFIDLGEWIDTDGHVEGYWRHLSAARSIEGGGMNVYKVCLAKEIDRQVSEYARKMGRHRSARAHLLDGAAGLFEIASRVLDQSHGALDPEDAAKAVVSAHLKLGMDFKRTEEVTKTENFATMCGD